MVARYAFHVGLSHPLLYAGLSRRFLPGTVAAVAVAVAAVAVAAEPRFEPNRVGYRA
jgi:hypothetical protein